MDTYLRSKYLARLSQHQTLLKSRINPEKYWGFVEHLKDHFKITGVDVELRQTTNPINGKIVFRINLEIYFEKVYITYQEMRKIFQLYFYEPHDVQFGQDFLFITLREDPIYYQVNRDPFPLYPSVAARTALDTSKHY